MNVMRRIRTATKNDDENDDNYDNNEDRDDDYLLGRVKRT
jgi:hypothetical protein